MAEEATNTAGPPAEDFVQEGVVYHVYQGIIPVYQGTWQVQEIQDDGTVLSFRCQPTLLDKGTRGPLVVNSSIQFRHEIGRLQSALKQSSEAWWAGQPLRTSKNMHDPIYVLTGVMTTSAYPASVPTSSNVIAYAESKEVERRMGQGDSEAEPQDLTERRKVLSGTELPPSPTPSENKETPDE